MKKKNPLHDLWSNHNLSSLTFDLSSLGNGSFWPGSKELKFLQLRVYTIVNVHFLLQKRIGRNNALGFLSHKCTKRCFFFFLNVGWGVSASAFLSSLDHFTCNPLFCCNRYHSIGLLLKQFYFTNFLSNMFLYMCIPY